MFENSRPLTEMEITEQNERLQIDQSLEKEIDLKITNACGICKFHISHYYNSMQLCSKINKFTNNYQVCKLFELED